MSAESLRPPSCRPFDTGPCTCGNGCPPPEDAVRTNTRERSEGDTVTRPVEDVVMRCQCPDPDHDCQNDAADHGADIAPALCVPCLYGCMP